MKPPKRLSLQVVRRERALPLASSAMNSFAPTCAIVEGVMGRRGTEPARKTDVSGITPEGNAGLMPVKTSQLLMATMREPSSALPRPAMRPVVMFPPGTMVAISTCCTALCVKNERVRPFAVTTVSPKTAMPA